MVKRMCLGIRKVDVYCDIKINNSIVI
jgi:hypothetical protein